MDLLHVKKQTGVYLKIKNIERHSESLNFHTDI